jgi:hypothetical protein
MNIYLDRQHFPRVHVMSTDQVIGVPPAITTEMEVSVESTSADSTIHGALRSSWFTEVTLYPSPGHARRHNVDALILSLVHNGSTKRVRLVQVRLQRQVLGVLLLSAQVEMLLLEDCVIEELDLMMTVVEDNEEEN